MRRVTVLFAVVFVVVAAVPVGAVAAGSQVAETQTDTPTETTATESETADANTTATSGNDSDRIAPGEQLAGVVAVQRAEIDGELESRSFGNQVSEAATNDSKARVVADQVNESRERLDELRERRSELRAAREAGNISRGRYNAQAARLTAEIRSLQRLLDRSSDAARGLPEETRRSNGIDSEEVERLRADAHNLSGDEVSAIARRVAGPNVGNGLADDEKPGNARNESNENSEADAPGRSDERGPSRANGDAGADDPGRSGERDRGPDSAPGRATDAADGDSSAAASGRSAGTINRDSETDANHADKPRNPGAGRERGADGSNNSNNSNDRRGPNADFDGLSSSLYSLVIW